MQSFKDLARKNFSEKFQGFRMLWTLALNTVKSHFNITKKADHLIANELITGYLRHQTLFLHTSDPQLKIEIFKQKPQLLQKINAHFDSLGYQQQIKDIRLK